MADVQVPHSLHHLHLAPIILDLSLVTSLKPTCKSWCPVERVLISLGQGWEQVGDTGVLTRLCTTHKTAAGLPWWSSG